MASLLCFAGVCSMIWEIGITRLRKRVIDKSQEERLNQSQLAVHSERKRESLGRVQFYIKRKPECFATLDAPRSE